jgi:hypothetical protein
MCLDYYNRYDCGHRSEKTGEDICWAHMHKCRGEALRSSEWRTGGDCNNCKKAVAKADGKRSLVENILVHGPARK